MNTKISLNYFGVSVQHVMCLAKKCNIPQKTQPCEVVQKDGHHYVSMKNNAQYGIELFNNRLTPCDAEITIDGNKIGRYRVNALSAWMIERPIGLQKNLVFVHESSKKATEAGVPRGCSDNGLVEIVFYPQNLRIKTNARNACFSNGSESDGDDMCLGFEYESGATVLEGENDQKMVEIPDITDIDTDNVTTIRFRMVCAPPQNDKPEALSTAGCIGEFTSPAQLPRPEYYGQAEYTVAGGFTSPAQLPRPAVDGLKQLPYHLLQRQSKPPTAAATRQPGEFSREECYYSFCEKPQGDDTQIFDPTDIKICDDASWHMPLGK